MKPLRDWCVTTTREGLEYVDWSGVLPRFARKVVREHVSKKGGGCAADKEPVSDDGGRRLLWESDGILGGAKSRMSGVLV